jgi:gluconate 2-dehydrogenase gamma chain
LSNSETKPVEKQPSTSRRNFIKLGVAAVAGAAVASAVEIPILNNSISKDNDKINQQASQISNLQSQLATAQQGRAFLTLNPTERPLVQAIAAAIIPTDSNGPGATEAGVVYFIDMQLAGNYGKAGNMFMQGPFVHPTTQPVTITNTHGTFTYSGGTIIPRYQAGTAYQYAFTPREFWRRGLIYLQQYSNSAYGNNFEKLGSATQIQILQDLFDNKPTNFDAPTPAEFFNEIHDMVIAGFLTDPVHGGNQDMVSWKLMGFNGNYWGDDIGLGAQKLMVASSPTRLAPKSLSDLQKEGGGV